MPGCGLFQRAKNRPVAVDPSDHKALGNHILRSAELLADIAVQLYWIQFQFSWFQQCNLHLVVSEA